MPSSESVAHAYRLHYNDPLGRLFDAADCPTESYGDSSYVYDRNGVAYLDWCSGYGVFSLGHGNHAIVGRVRDQIGTLAWVPADCPHGGVARLRDRLTPLLPPGLNHVMISGSGSEAIEYALLTLLAGRTSRHKIIAAHNSYHGKTLGALCLMGQPHLRVPFGQLGLDVEFVPYGDCAAIDAAIDDRTLAVFLEPILGGGYLTVPPPGYLALAESLCRARGARLVLDEVQTGFGRTGRMFAFERDGVAPDILVVSKTITGGCVPVALTVVHDDIVEALGGEDEMPQPSWQGSLVACAAAVASIDYLSAHDLPRQAEEKGRYLHGELRALVEKHPALVVDAPGVGLMLGLRARSVLVEHALWLQLLSRGVVGGLSTNASTRQPVLRVFPPLTISYEEIGAGVVALSDALETLRRWPSLLLRSAELSFHAQHYLPMPLLRLGCRMFRLGRRTSRKRSAPAIPASGLSRSDL